MVKQFFCSFQGGTDDDNVSTLVQSEIRDVDFNRSSLGCGAAGTSKGCLFGTEEDSHSSSTHHSTQTVYCRELRRNLYSSKEIFQRIPPLRIEWADESEVDRIWEHDDMFMRIILCISDICVLKWEMTEVDFLSEATIALTDVSPIRFSEKLSLYVDVTVATVLCFSSWISICFSNESWNKMKNEEIKIQEALSFVAQQSKTLDSPLVEELPQILQAEKFYEEMKFANDEEVAFSYNESNEVMPTEDLQESARSCKNYVLKNKMLEKYRSVLELPQTKAMPSFDVTVQESYDGFLLDNILQVAATIMDVKQAFMQHNESLSNQIFETEKEISLDKIKKLNLACQLHHSSVLYSTQSKCPEILDNEDTVVSLNVPDAMRKSPIVLSEVPNSLSEFDSLQHQKDEDSLLYIDDGRVCLGNNSSFSIMYTNRCCQPEPQENEMERLQEIKNAISEFPGMCDQGGDHAVDKDKKAKGTATILKVYVNLNEPVGDSDTMKKIPTTDERNQEFDLEVRSSTMRNLVTTQSHIPTGFENGAPSIESPNRSFCFTSTPAYSSNASISATVRSSSVRSSMSSTNSRIPQIKEALNNNPTEKAAPVLPYPLLRGVQKLTSVAPKTSVGKDNKMIPKNGSKVIVNGGASSTLTKVKIGKRDSKIPRPPIPSNGEDSSRSTVLIPSSRVTSRMSEQSTSSSCYLPPSSCLKRKVMKPSLSSPKPSPTVATTPGKAAARPAPITSVIPSKPIISSGGSNGGAKNLKPMTGPVAMSDADLDNFVCRIKARMKRSKENQEEMAKMFNEALMGNSSFNFRENTLSSMQLAKVLSKFDPSMVTYAIKDRQKIALKLMNTKDQKVDLKTLMAACNR